MVASYGRERTSRVANSGLFRSARDPQIKIIGQDVQVQEIASLAERPDPLPRSPSRRRIARRSNRLCSPLKSQAMSPGSQLLRVGRSSFSGGPFRSLPPIWS